MKTKDTFVTKEWLAEKVKANPSKVIGRALSAIYRNQTYQEQDNTVTVLSNGIGFSKPDARVGSIGARMFDSKGVLEPWVITVWSRPAKDGLPRICKYAGQLNDIASVKASKVLAQAQNQNGIIPLTKKAKELHKEGFPSGWGGDVTLPNFTY